MSAVQFFHRSLPVIGDAEVIDFDDGPHKVWSVICHTPQGDVAIPMREKLGVVTLQQRVDDFVRKESSSLPFGGKAMIWAHHIEPSNVEMLGVWMQGHHKRSLS